MKLDSLEKMIRNTDYPLEQIFDALQIPVEKRNQYSETLASVLARRTTGGQMICYCESPK